MFKQIYKVFSHSFWVNPLSQPYNCVKCACLSCVRETEDYDSQYLGEDSDTQEARDRKERTSFIHKQFKLRKQVHALY